MNLLRRMNLSELQRSLFFREGKVRNYPSHISMILYFFAQK